jgi:hypothetical protein
MRNAWKRHKAFGSNALRPKDMLVGFAVLGRAGGKTAKIGVAPAHPFITQIECQTDAA